MPITLEFFLKNQLSKDRKTDTLEDIIGQLENQTQYDNNLGLTETTHMQQT